MVQQIELNEAVTHTAETSGLIESVYKKRISSLACLCYLFLMCLLCFPFS